MSLDHRLREIAKAIGWEKDPKDLMEEGWEGEETMEEAKGRK